MLSCPLLEFQSPKKLPMAKTSFLRVQEGGHTGARPWPSAPGTNGFKLIQANIVLNLKLGPKQEQP